MVARHIGNDPIIEWLISILNSYWIDSYRYVLLYYVSRWHCCWDFSCRNFGGCWCCSRNWLTTLNCCCVKRHIEYSSHLVCFILVTKSFNIEPDIWWGTVFSQCQGKNFKLLCHSCRSHTLCLCIVPRSDLSCAKRFWNIKIQHGYTLRQFNCLSVLINVNMIQLVELGNSTVTSIITTICNITSNITIAITYPGVRTTWRAKLDAITRVLTLPTLIVPRCLAFNTDTVSTIPVTFWHIASFVAIFVIYPGGGTPLVTVWDRPCEVELLAICMGVEVIWPNIISKHDIIIKINKLLRKARDFMQVRFYSWRAEGW